MRGFSILLTVLFFGPSILSAQPQQAVAVGERVRVSHCHSEVLNSGRPRHVCERTVGTVSALSTDTGTLRVEGEATELAFALNSVTSLELSRGRESWGWWKGGLLGFVGGGVIGLFIGGAVVGASDCDDWACLGPFFSGLFVGADVGLLSGAAIGGLIKTERWDEAPLDRLRLSFAPRQDGIAVGLSVSF